MLPARDHVTAPATPVDRWLIALFVAAISLPLVLTLATIGNRPADDQKRDLAAWPGPMATWRDVERWPTRFRHWFEDHYAGRTALIRAHGAVTLRGVGVAPSATVLLGRDGWWYYTDDGAMDDIVSAAPMDEAALALWAQSLDDNRAWLAERGIPYLFVLAPDKHAIYPEFLPSTVHPLGPWRGDQFAREMRQRTQVDFLHLAERLIAQKPVERVYHRTDTHWNARGALLAYQEIEQWLVRVGRADAVTPRDAFTFTEAMLGGQDIPRMLGIEALVHEQSLGAVPRAPRMARVVEPAGADILSEEGRLVTEHPDTTLPRMVVFRDSFMSQVIPFLAERCSRCVFLWEKDLNPAIIEQERPDLVIHEMVGRRLQSYLPYDPFRP